MNLNGKFPLTMNLMGKFPLTPTPLPKEREPPGAKSAL
jgi:hypothetical protein